MGGYILSLSPADQEYGTWIAQVRGVPMRLLQLELIAKEPIHCDRFPGSKLNGALWGKKPAQGAIRTGLAAVADHDPDPCLRAWARQARQYHERRQGSAGYTERPMALDAEFAPLHLNRGDVYVFNLSLFGAVTETWPAWVQAARTMSLDPGRLTLRYYAVWDLTGWKAYTPFRDDALSVTTLGDLAGVTLKIPVFSEDWLLTTQTPLVLESEKRKLESLETLEPLVVSAFSALGAVADCRPGRENSRHLRDLARQVTVKQSHMEYLRALYHQPDDGRPYPVNGLAGQLRLSALPLQLVEILTLAQLTHVGQGSAFGLGSYVLQPLGV